MEYLVESPTPMRTIGPIPMTGQREIRRIGLMLFDGCSLLTAGIIAEAFRMANEIALQRTGRPAYQLSLLSHRGGIVACSSSVRVWTQGLDVLGQRGFNAIFIGCSEREPSGERDARLMNAMIEVSASVLERSPRSGQRTQPAQPRVSRAIPQKIVEVDEVAGISHVTSSVFWCRDGAVSAPDVMPSAADMALAQIEFDLGFVMATEVARRLAPQRDTPLARQETPEPDDVPDIAASSEALEKVRASARWITAHYAEEISVADAARIAAMSERNYLRRFKCALGMTPSEYLIRARLEMICRLLKETDLPVDKIARRCGMGNGDRLAKIFRKRFELSPTAYRNLDKTALPDAA
ncbi:Transcriptional regulator GlxA family, contains an amidase domain and an AraC-type DNA-binding HTH domain [Cupriavidus sp. OV038]|uniref:GlxA family transcriptional regulator n=1 Tax=unclassified Cupriavidus TaxID=2640874 RepID=UPI0008F2EBC7|nr:MULTISPECIES: helix-turn-helix domain-containing protein [unclassified Cupriavidus]SFC21285.1 Transcriptional regulator GlxA family, contains an amidase domain and an AraC-type DNA-binding HTH domain [Cupriavidus sp. OV038]SFP15567.1 Transcriptional regulator GlxA family, contains an amidase domain and an AraC-type DNA-binding HTH domain [Cupriavidus sp. OV096]